MKIYLAGVPAGNQAKREHHLKRIGVQFRLITFYYPRQANITMQNFKCGGKVVNSDRESYDVYIGRSGTTPLHNYGNPFTTSSCGSKKKAVAKFRDWLKGKYPHIEPERRKWILENIKGLKGKTLGCRHNNPPCHGFVLLEFANKE